AMDAAIKLDNSNIAVFDSLQTAGGLHLLVKHAKIMANEGSTLSEIYMALPKLNSRISTFFSVNDMFSLRKSGRIGIVRMNVSTIMNLRPILALKDGTIVSEEMARGTMDVITKLSDRMPYNTKEAVINYIENTDTAIGVYNALKTKAPYLPIRLRKAGPVLAIHVGLGFVSVSYITQ
ncbi:MAG: DegV family EDD domain-containing protein, partial [Clostridiaceae bacterium]|nr:DegV family EDD domain-containing protein [Clostridiaceae bacterium]